MSAVFSEAVLITARSQFFSQFGITPSSGNLCSLYFEYYVVIICLDFAFSLSLSGSLSPYMLLSSFSPLIFLHGVSAAATECFFYYRDLDLQSPLIPLPYCISTLLWLPLMTFFVSLSPCFASSSPPPLL